MLFIQSVSSIKYLGMSKAEEGLQRLSELQALNIQTLWAS